ncbi:MAG: NAD-dependent epimerase/dehydratase family protein [Candidatus Wildermuthbacteria bacterium]|nr:NAD-dependent epimerase/dehydratase family protein [Candidatus Wildermuthbacteria bacterium]
MRAIVTGASGLVGSYLSEQLLERGYEVLGLSYGQEEHIAHLKQKKNFQYMNADIRDFERILEIFQQYHPQGVFHAAALLPPKAEGSDPFPFFEINVRGTLNVLEACCRSGMKKIIYSSSMNVYGKDIQILPVKETCPPHPFDFYSITKLQGEEFCRLYAEFYGLQTTVLRCSGIHGFPRKGGAVYSFIRNALDNKPLEILSDMSWDTLYVEDVARANILAFEKDSPSSFSIFNIGGGKEIHLKDLAQKIIAMTNSQSEIVTKESTGSSHFFLDISKAKEQLGFSPRPLEEGLQEFIQKLRE